MPNPLFVLLMGAVRMAVPIIVRRAANPPARTVATQAPRQIAEQAASQGTTRGVKLAARQAPTKAKAALPEAPKARVCTKCEGARSSLQSDGPYAHLKDHPSVGPGKNFTQSQKNRILKANQERNGGTIRSDGSGQELVRPQKHQKGVSPPKNEAHVDHHVPKSKGGANSSTNARVLSREENLKKGDKHDRNED